MLKNDGNMDVVRTADYHLIVSELKNGLREGSTGKAVGVRGRTGTDKSHVADNILSHCLLNALLREALGVGGGFGQSGEYCLKKALVRKGQEKSQFLHILIFCSLLVSGQRPTFFGTMSKFNGRKSKFTSKDSRDSLEDSSIRLTVHR